MASLVHRILSAASVQGWCKLYGGAAFYHGGRNNLRVACISSTSRHVTSHRLHPMPASQYYPPTNYLLLKTSTCSKNSDLQFYRVFSSEASEEDDTNVDYDSLVKRIDSGNIQLIDVREPSELAEFGQITNSIHIPLGGLADALNLPEDKFEAKYHRRKPKTTDASIVFHCRSGVRSLNAVNIAKEIGYSKARHYPGGWLQWAEKNNLPSA